MTQTYREVTPNITVFNTRFPNWDLCNSHDFFEFSFDYFLKPIHYVIKIYFMSSMTSLSKYVM